MNINGIDLGPIMPVRLTVRPSQAVEENACRLGFNLAIDACCPEAKGEGLDEEGRYILTSDPEISLADMVKAGLDFDHITWAFRLLEGPEAERTLRLFAAACAAEALPMFEEKRPCDNRPRACVEAVVGFAHGTVTRERLAAAWAAAWDAAWAAWDAAMDARAAWDAAMDARAARDAALAAALAAAGDAAGAVMGAAGAVMGAAGAAARAATIKRQREILLALVEVTP